MRIGENMTRSMFGQFLNKRDNNKGRVSEADFADWSFTTQRIIDRLHAQSKMIGDYSIEDYELWNKVKGLITPREIRLQDEAVYLNIKDNTIDKDELHQFEMAEWSTSNRNEATFVEEHEKYVASLERVIAKHNDRLNKQIKRLESADGDVYVDEDGNEHEVDNSCRIDELKDQLVKWDSELDDVDDLPYSILSQVTRPGARSARILPPSEYKDVQRRMLKQLSIKDGSFVKFTDSYTDRSTLKLSDLGEYSIEGRTLNQPLDGFRPIALKKEISFLLDMEEFRGKAETNFLNWFRSLME